MEILHSEGPFDLVLLDIMMPKVSGYDVCQQLRKTWSVNDLPVIFLTAKNQVDDLVQSFAMGGNDYLTKPVTKHELLARVKIQLEMLDINRNLEIKVQQRTAELQQSLVQLKAAQQKLIESEKMASLGNMVAGVAHEINTPLGICITMVSLQLDKLRAFADKIEQGKMTRKSMDTYLAETKESQTLVTTSLQRAASLVDDFKKVAVEQQHIKRELVEFHQLLSSIIAVITPKLERKHIELVLDEAVEAEQGVLDTYPEAWSQIMLNLFDNSLAHGFAYSNISDGQIAISTKFKPQHFVLIYQDNGQGMNEIQQEKIFEPFYTTTRHQGGTGLGMHLVFNLVTHKLGGSIQCNSAVNQGVEFIIEVPLNIQ